MGSRSDAGGLSNWRLQDRMELLAAGLGMLPGLALSSHYAAAGYFAELFQERELFARQLLSASSVVASALLLQSALRDDPRFGVHRRLFTYIVLGALGLSCAAFVGCERGVSSVSMGWLLIGAWARESCTGPPNQQAVFRVRVVHDVRSCESSGGPAPDPSPATPMPSPRRCPGRCPGRSLPVSLPVSQSRLWPHWCLGLCRCRCR